MGLNTSPFTCSDSLKMASTLPRLMLMFLPKYRCTTPGTISFSIAYQSL